MEGIIAEGRKWWKKALRGVALSGYGMEEDIRRSKSAGFAYHLTKPVDPAKIDQLLANLTREIRGPGSVARAPAAAGA